VRRLFGNYKLKIEGKPQNQQQEVSEDADFTDRKQYHNRPIRRIVAVLEDIR